SSSSSVSHETMQVQAEYDRDGLFQQLDGKPLSLSDFHGSNVLLNYWATWCAPCIEEIPSLLNAVEKLGDDYRLLLVSDEPADTISSFLSDNGFEGPFIRLTEAFSQHGVKAVPSTLLFNTEGQQVQQWLGNKEWDSAAMLAE